MHFHLTRAGNGLSSAHETISSRVFDSQLLRGGGAGAGHRGATAIDKLSGQIQDLTDAQVAQGKHIEALEKEISDLQSQVNQPAASAAKARMI